MALGNIAYIIGIYHLRDTLDHISCALDFKPHTVGNVSDLHRDLFSHDLEYLLCLC